MRRGPPRSTRTDRRFPDTTLFRSRGRGGARGPGRGRGRALPRRAPRSGVGSRDPAFRAGFACLGRLGLTFDAWVYHPQLVDVLDLARAFPDRPIVLNHVGGPDGIGPYPGGRDEAFVDGSRSMRELAGCGNAFRYARLRVGRGGSRTGRD